MPGIRVVDHAVALAIPSVPIVALRSHSDFVTRIGASSAHRRHIACLDVGNALRSSQLRLALAHNDDAVAIRPHFNAIHAILMRRMQSNVRRIDAKYGEKSAADPKLLTVNDETISDARAAVALLARQPGINPEQVFLLGHSLGAYLAPRIATGNAIIAGIVIMGGNTKPMEQLIVDQIRYLTNTGESPSAESESQIDAAQRAAAQIESPDLKPGDEVPLLGSTTYGAYWLDLRNYNPVKTAQKLKIPILVLQGGRDYQVTPANYSDWQSGLGKRANATLKLFPDANHLFMERLRPGLPEGLRKARPCRPRRNRHDRHLAPPQPQPRLPKRPPLRRGIAEPAILLGPRSRLLRDRSRSTLLAG